MLASALHLRTEQSEGLAKRVLAAQLLHRSDLMSEPFDVISCLHWVSFLQIQAGEAYLLLNALFMLTSPLLHSTFDQLFCFCKAKAQ